MEHNPTAKEPVGACGVLMEVRELERLPAHLLQQLLRQPPILPQSIQALVLQRLPDTGIALVVPVVVHTCLLDLVPKPIVIQMPCLQLRQTISMAQLTMGQPLFLRSFLVTILSGLVKVAGRAISSLERVTFLGHLLWRRPLFSRLRIYALLRIQVVPETRYTLTSLLQDLMLHSIPLPIPVLQENQKMPKAFLRANFG